MSIEPDAASIGSPRAAADHADSESILAIPSMDPFYRAPAGFERAEPGTVLRSREVNLALFGVIRQKVSAWQLLYRTTSLDGAARVAVTTVVLPVGGRTRPQRALLSYQCAIDSVSDRCFPSYVLRSGARAVGSVPQFEFMIILYALRRGWVLSLPDHEGMNGQWGAPIAARPATQRISLQWALDSITDGVAFVRNQRQDLLATNELGRAFYAPIIGDGGRAPNLARFQFLDPSSREFYPDWDKFAEMCVSIMRAEAGRDPHDKGLQDLVGELSTRDETFRKLWGAHNVRTHGAGKKRFNHPVVGEVHLAYEELVVTADPGSILMVYTAEPGSPSAERLHLLGSWAAQHSEANS